MQCIREIVVDGKYIKIIRNLYWDQTASVRIMNELSEDIRIQRGVRQGCVATPTLFNVYTDKIFTHIINMKGVGEEQNHHVSSKVPATCCKSLNLECMYCRFSCLLQRQVSLSWILGLFTQNGLCRVNDDSLIIATGFSTANSLYRYGTVFNRYLFSFAFLSRVTVSRPPAVALLLSSLQKKLLTHILLLLLC